MLVFCFYRLRLLDATKDEDGRCDPLPEFHMDTPQPDQYKDVHGGMLSSFVALTSDRVSEYMASNEKVVEEKSKAMYNERYGYLI